MTTTYNDEPVTIIAVNGGWTTIELFDGEVKKVRNGQLKEKSMTNATPQTESTAAVRAAPVASEAPVANEATETKPKAPTARPPHFVGDVAPGKVARIGETEFNVGRYFVSDIKTAAGRRTIDCADEVAKYLRGMDLEDVYTEAARALDVPVNVLKDKYGALNQGMQRMNLGNRIRGAGKAAEREKARAEAKAKRDEEAKVRAEAKAKKEAEQEAAKAAKAAEREKARAEKVMADKAKKEAKAKPKAEKAAA